MKSIEFKAAIRAFKSKAWSYYIEVPREIGNPFVVSEGRRVLCYINDAQPLHSALMPKGKFFSIFLKKEFMKKHHLDANLEVHIRLEKDTSRYGTELPESFETLLNQDEEGNTWFQQLSKNNQRLLIQIVNKVKNVDSQLNKGLAIMHHLKEKRGAVNFNELNETIKAFNNRHQR